VTATVLVAVWLALAAAAQAPPPARVLDAGAQSGIEDPRQVFITSKDAFESIWRQHSNRQAPPVDFSHDDVIAIFLGSRPTSGYAVDIVSIEPAASGGTVVRYREQRPARDAMTAQVLTSPYVVAAVGKGLREPVRFEASR
jgi:hypothetical protein